ncbi:MAG: DUF4350 domain-containing protein, partial [Sedimentisphaerales bacterium]|nr:DUF4350 domain-containing protein [Sedimentisphaerales bacterium]
RVRQTGKGSAVWKAGYASPASAAWHSSLSPVLASLDLFDASYQPGQDVTTELLIINDSWHDASIHVDIMLTEECPEYIPEASCFERPVSKWSYDFELKADTLRSTNVTWKLPAREGSYWLTARTTGIAGRPVLSQRFVRAVAPPIVSASLRERRYIILGGDHVAESWFQSKGLQTGNNLDELMAGKDIVVVWNYDSLTTDEKRHAGAIRRFVSAGGRVVVLATHHWDWSELCDVKAGEARGSRAFLYEKVKYPMLSGIRPEWLIRWNSRPGTVAVANLEGPAIEQAEKILWVRDPATCVAAEIPIAGGKGTILFSQLDVQWRLNRSEASYDPVAERILMNILKQTD